jgi:hypothetical protein
MFGTRKYRTAAGMMHSSNIDELMEAYRDEAKAAATAAPPIVQAIASTPLARAVIPTAGTASGAIAAEVSYKPVGKAA